MDITVEIGSCQGHDEWRSAPLSAPFHNGSVTTSCMKCNQQIGTLSFKLCLHHDAMSAASKQSGPAQGGDAIATA